MEFEEQKKAIIDIIGAMMISGKSRLYRHMIDASIGREVKDWYTDDELTQLSVFHGPFELEIYRFMRKHENEFLSKENLMMKSWGAVLVYWKSGGSSEAVIYNNRDGERMLCCANWISGPTSLRDQLPGIESIEKLVL